MTPSQKTKKELFSVKMRPGLVNRFKSEAKAEGTSMTEVAMRSIPILTIEALLDLIDNCGDDLKIKTPGGFFNEGVKVMLQQIMLQDEQSPTVQVAGCTNVIEAIMLFKIFMMAKAGKDNYYLLKMENANPQPGDLPYMWSVRNRDMDAKIASLNAQLAIMDRYKEIVKDKTNEK